MAGGSGSNEFKLGSGAWIERERYNEIRAMLDAVLAGEMTIEEAKGNLWCFDTDSASF